MSDLLFSINAVVPLFIIMLLGWILTQLKVWNKDFLKTANSLTFNVFLPAMLFYNVYTSDFRSVFDARLLVFVICIVALICTVAFIFVPILSKVNARRGVITQALFRSNFALLGIPLCQAIAGDAGGHIASVFLAFVIPIFNVLATVVLSIYGNDKIESPILIIKKILKNPLIISCALGMIFMFLKIPLPEIILTPIKNVKNIATPFALLIIGGDFEFKSFVGNFKCVLATGLSRMLLIPTLVLIAAYFLGFRGVSIALLLSTFATPVAVSSTPMAFKMNGDYDLACQLVVFTTLVSAGSILFFTYAVKALGII